MQVVLVHHGIAHNLHEDLAGPHPAAAIAALQARLVACLHPPQPLCQTCTNLKYESEVSRPSGRTAHQTKPLPPAGCSPDKQQASQPPPAGHPSAGHFLVQESSDGDIYALWHHRTPLAGRDGQPCLPRSSLQAPCSPEKSRPRPNVAVAMADTQTVLATPPSQRPTTLDFPAGRQAGIVSPTALPSPRCLYPATSPLQHSDSPAGHGKRLHSATCSPQEQLKRIRSADAQSMRSLEGRQAERDLESSVHQCGVVFGADTAGHVATDETPQQCAARGGAGQSRASADNKEEEELGGDDAVHQTADSAVVGSHGCAKSDRNAKGVHDTPSHSSPRYLVTSFCADADVHTCCHLSMQVQCAERSMPTPPGNNRWHGPQQAMHSPRTIAQAVAKQVDDGARQITTAWRLLPPEKPSVIGCADSPQLVASCTPAATGGVEQLQDPSEAPPKRLLSSAALKAPGASNHAERVVEVARKLAATPSARHGGLAGGAQVTVRTHSAGAAKQKRVMGMNSPAAARNDPKQRASMRSGCWQKRKPQKLVVV
jgi:hypothetical protein